MTTNVYPLLPPLSPDMPGLRAERIQRLRAEVMELNVLQLRYVVGFLMEDDLDLMDEALAAARDAWMGT